MRPRTSGSVMATLACGIALTLAVITSCTSTADKSDLVRPAGEPGKLTLKAEAEKLSLATVTVRCIGR